ncbi:hypothetical protein BDD12DRAFT_810877 [Trichophaea hybrida]|nr:hypothetical protein BDD12DRAFT_810877 [Trichophaea hybrida]
MISARDHRSDTLPKARSPTPPKPFSSILLWDFLDGQYRPWRPINPLPKDERLYNLNQVVDNVDIIVTEVDGPGQHSFKSLEILTNQLSSFNLPDDALEVLRVGIQICGPKYTWYLQSFTAAGDQGESSSRSRRRTQSVIPSRPSRNNGSPSRNRKGKEKQKDESGDDRGDPSDETNSGESGLTGKAKDVQCPICKYDPSPADKNPYSGTWYNARRHINTTHLKEIPKQQSLVALEKLRLDVEHVCTGTKRVEELEDLLLHRLDNVGRRRKRYDSKDGHDWLPKDPDPNSEVGAAYQIGKQLDSKFNAQGSDQAQVICSFIAGLSRDARLCIGNVLSAADSAKNVETTGMAGTGKRKRHAGDMSKSPDAEPSNSKRQMHKPNQTNHPTGSAGPSNAAPSIADGLLIAPSSVTHPEEASTSQIGDITLRQDRFAQILPQTGQNEGQIQSNNGGGGMSEQNISQDVPNFRDLSNLWDCDEDYEHQDGHLHFSQPGNCEEY